MKRSPTRRLDSKVKRVECDGCGKVRLDVKCVGRDANGDPDAPCLCFICRREGARGRVYSKRYGTYVWPEDLR